MAVKPIAALKGYFNTGDTPTEANFADLIDSQGGFETVADMLADTTGYGAAGYAEGDIVRAGGNRYQVVASDAPTYHLENAADTAVRFLVLPGADGSFSLQAFGAPGDNSTDEKDALDAAISAAASSFSLAVTNGGMLTSRPGAVHRFSGRLRVKSGVSLMLGRSGASAALRPTDTDGGVELEAGACLEGTIFCNTVDHVGPALEINSAKSTQTFSYGERHTTFNVIIRGRRNTGSKGILMTDDDGGGGVAWVDGYADILEMDYPCDLVSNNAGYVNSNTLDLKIYDGVESLRLIVNDTGEVDANRIRVTTQTGSDDRSGLNLYCDGERNDIEMICWDWSQARLDDSSYSGVQAILTDKSGSNYLRGYMSRLSSDKMSVEDFSPEATRNNVSVVSSRVREPFRGAILPSGYKNSTFIGDQDDQLAWAAHDRYTVTTSGATPPDTTNLERLFQPDGYGMVISSCTEAIITVDFGESISGSFMTGVVLYSDGSIPDRVKIDRSTDNSSWTTVLQAGYDGDTVPPVLHRYDGGGIGTFRYLRLTVENDVAATVGVTRWVLGNSGTQKAEGAWLPRYNPEVYGKMNVERSSGSDGYFVNGTRVVSSQRAAIADSVGSDEQAKINAILAALREHGLIAT